MLSCKSRGKNQEHTILKIASYMEYVRSYHWKVLARKMTIFHLFDYWKNEDRTKWQYIEYFSC